MQRFALSLLGALVLCIWSGAAIAQTERSGGVFEDETWEPSGNPYIVSEQLVVFEGATLTLQPGVHILFDKNASMEVRGKFRGLGTAEAPVVLSSFEQTPELGDWGGIKFIGLTDPLGEGEQAIFEHCRISYAGVAVDLDNAHHPPYTFESCVFTHNSIGIAEADNSGPVWVSNCLFEYNITGIKDGFDADVSGSIFRNNEIGINVAGHIIACHFSENTNVALIPYGTTQRCEIINNNIGVQSMFNAGNATFINNRVSGNSIGLEIRTFYNGSIEFNNNIICNNSEYNIDYKWNLNADLSDNCWCSDDEAVIREGIRDGYVDVQYGLVTVTPIFDVCDDNFPSDILPEPSFLDVDFHMAPNPAVERITAQFTLHASDKIRLEIFDTFGKKAADIFDEFLQPGKHTVPFAVEDLTNGVYICRMTSANGAIAHTTFMVNK